MYKNVFHQKAVSKSAVRTVIGRQLHTDKVASSQYLLLFAVSSMNRVTTFQTTLNSLTFP